MGLSGNFYVPDPIPNAWMRLGLKISAMETIVQQTERQLSDIVQAFLA